MTRVRGISQQLRNDFITAVYARALYKMRLHVFEAIDINYESFLFTLLFM